MDKIIGLKEELTRSRLRLAEARLEAEMVRIETERVHQECQREHEWWISVKELPLDERVREIEKHYRAIEEEEAKKNLIILLPFFGKA